MKILLTRLLAALLALGAGAAHAYQIPYNIPNIQSFLNNGTYFGVHTWVQLTAYNFTGAWEYTAIGSEASHKDLVEDPVFTVGFSTSSYVFSNFNTSNWGSFKQINFNSGNIFFEDKDGPYNIPLDPFSSANAGYFKVYQLLADSKMLSYLAHPVKLYAGTIIVGFNDNGIPVVGDRDFDDIVIALRPVPAPEPGMIVLFLLGIGLVALSTRQRQRV